METTYRLKSTELNIAFLMSLKNIYDNQEIEINIKSLNEPNLEEVKKKQAMLRLLHNAKNNAPKIDPSINIRALIDQTHDREI